MTGTETLWRQRIITLGPEGRSGWEPLSRPSRTDKKEAKSVTEMVSRHHVQQWEGSGGADPVASGKLQGSGLCLSLRGLAFI